MPWPSGRSTGRGFEALGGDLGCQADSFETQGLNVRRDGHGLAATAEGELPEAEGGGIDPLDRVVWVVALSREAAQAAEEIDHIEVFVLGFDRAHQYRVGRFKLGRAAAVANAGMERHDVGLQSELLTDLAQGCLDGVFAGFD